MTFRIKNTRLLFRQAGLILILQCIAIILMALALPSGLNAQVTVSVDEITGVNGQEAIVYVRASHTLGQPVYSLQLKLQPDNTALQLLQASKGSSLSADWSVPVVNFNGSSFSVASFGTQAITTGDELLRLRFALIGNVETVIPLVIQQFYFNEGLPCLATKVYVANQTEDHYTGSANFRKFVQKSGNKYQTK